MTMGILWSSETPKESYTYSRIISLRIWDGLRKKESFGDLRTPKVKAVDLAVAAGEALFRSVGVVSTRRPKITKTKFCEINVFGMDTKRM